MGVFGDKDAGPGGDFDFRPGPTVAQQMGMMNAAGELKCPRGADGEVKHLFVIGKDRCSCGEQVSPGQGYAGHSLGRDRMGHRIEPALTDDEWGKLEFDPIPTARGEMIKRVWNPKGNLPNAMSDLGWQDTEEIKRAGKDDIVACPNCGADVVQGLLVDGAHVGVAGLNALIPDDSQYKFKPNQLKALEIARKSMPSGVVADSLLELAIALEGILPPGSLGVVGSTPLKEKE